ncbi:hypothetical protein AAFN88_02400 [Pelagibius sp. CAU 1746]|uniref:hypothetical protein n=1 Tax=Pelagibius sp. CAU 1746 TaxID=3140370 RepID=UPI00325B513B
MSDLLRVVSEAPPAAEEVRPLAERPLDAFMLCSFNVTTPSVEELRAHYAKTASPMVKVIDEVYGTGLLLRNASILALFLDSFQRHFGTPLILNRPMSQADRAALLVLSCIDLRIRLDRRLKTLAGLARLDPELRMVVTLDPKAGTLCRGWSGAPISSCWAESKPPARAGSSSSPSSPST